jgi:FMN phosphatase YigB (HAD superfamily)
MKSTANLKAILFDIDDTLFNRAKAQHEVAKLFFHNYPDIFSDFNPSEVENAFVESDHLVDEKIPHIIDIRTYRIERSKIFLELLGIQKDVSHLLTQAYINLYPTVNAAVEGMDQVLTSIYKKFRLGIISNGYEDVQYSKLKSLGIIHIFDCILIIGEGENSKPNKDVFIRACNSLNTPPHNCLYIGDSYEKDVVGSKNAGMISCWYNPDQKKYDHEIKPDYTIKQFAELLNIIP